jgi:hypothetical protein
VAVSNNIKGNAVETNQNIKEFNDEDLKNIATALRRIALSNKINGDNVKTNQNIKEYNMKVAEGPKRIKKNKVKTMKNKKDFNDEDIKKLANALRRIALSNNIKGGQVKTNQNVKEYNDAIDDEAQDDAIDDEAQDDAINDEAQDDAFDDEAQDDAIDDEQAQDEQAFNDEQTRRIAISNSISGNAVHTDVNALEYNDEMAAANDEMTVNFQDEQADDDPFTRRLTVNNNVAQQDEGEVINTNHNIEEITPKKKN